MSQSGPVAATPRPSDVGREVLQTEAAALSMMAHAIGADFDRAVATLLACKGRVIATGIGKSGAIARKIASTLASMGTPSFFVHPAEASHGDLGMVCEDDVLLAMSRSGETAEMTDMLVHAKRFSVPVVAITAEPTSTMATFATVCLLLPKVPEACLNGLAPTTSTTATLAIGDALAVAVAAARGFSAHEFGALHPGGKLGAQLRRVRDLMRRDAALPLVPLGTKVGPAILEMTSKALGCVGVLDGRELVGIFTDGDLRRHLGPSLLDQDVEDVMSPYPKMVHADVLAVEALRQMNDANISALFVYDDYNAVVGALHMHDCVRSGVV